MGAYYSLINKLHGMSKHVQRKHELLRVAYPLFLEGLTLSALLAIGTLVF